jgi:hypothetical protein
MNQSVLVGVSILTLVVGTALSAESENKYDGVYTGTRTLTKGTASGCPAKDNVSVTIHGETLTFTNSALKKYVMPFDPTKDGLFGEIQIDADGFAGSYHGRVVGGVIDADATNPNCDYHWHLTKKQ